jgi:hypothetical protein
MGDTLLFARYVPPSRGGAKGRAIAALKQHSSGLGLARSLPRANHRIRPTSVAESTAVRDRIGDDSAMPPVSMQQESLAAWHERVASPAARWARLVGSPAYLKDRSRSIAFSADPTARRPGIRSSACIATRICARGSRDPCLEPRVIHFGQEQKDLGDATR